jgi:hypothetical protein
MKLEHLLFFSFPSFSSFILHPSSFRNGTKVLAAARLALNQVGESSSLSGPTGWWFAEPILLFDNSAATKHTCVFVGWPFLSVVDSHPGRTGMSILPNARQAPVV